MGPAPALKMANVKQVKTWSARGFSSTSDWKGCINLRKCADITPRGIFVRFRGQGGSLKKLVLVQEKAMANSLFEEKIYSDVFLVTTEIGPPKGVDVSEMIHHIELLKDKVDAINVTDHQSSVMRFPSLGGCLLVREYGGEPILQMTTRDRNRLALQADLLLAYSRGIRNVLCLTGDSVDVGDHKEAKPVFDLDSVQLLKMIRKLESGTDMAGKELKRAPRFYEGASVHPAADFIEPQLVKLDKKVAAGAQFFQTQGIFDLTSFHRFMQYASQFDVKILAGIIVMASARMA